MPTEWPESTRRHRSRTRWLRAPTDVTLPFWISYAVVIAAQASLVALPAAAFPAALRRLRGAAWALVPAASIAIVVGGLAAAPGAADFLTYLALIATPLLAAVALGHVVYG